MLFSGPREKNDFVTGIDNSSTASNILCASLRTTLRSPRSISLPQSSLRKCHEESAKDYLNPNFSSFVLVVL